MEQISQHRAAVAKSLASFATLYGSKFVAGSGALDIWADTLSDLTADEIQDAVRTWSNTQKWPPTPADLRGLIPRFCRCQNCAACRKRALARAGAAVARGSVGALMEPEESIDEVRGRFFRGPKQLGGGGR